MRQWIPVVLIVGVVSALGISNLPYWRSSTIAEAQRIQTKLDQFPTTLGDWRSEPQPITEKMLKHGEAQGHLSRLYRKPGVAQPLNVLVLIGTPGAMGAHTPEFCYAGLGYQRAGRVEKLAIPGEQGSELWTTAFAKPNEAGAPLQVIWGHGVGGRWLASDTPRFDFANEALIFKVYVSRNQPQSPPSGLDPTDPLAEFLELFFREFRLTFSIEP